ncbi:ATP-dependent endonuclease [Salinibacterium sp. SWN167]|uniref:ATP-dependent nuclease n=1 Tax=Salinibacterium sp. SWN167 TaxID=2792054 RepID=UPI0018CFD96D|nr:AAA family ATPase [Salinibacterium sp. SWN167]MBH0083782.1 AAA family ATPase [Salinibacterium sp. SWN167]
MEHAIVGFEPLGDPVLGGEFVPFEGGLNVIYGLNGAGKSRLLTGIRNSLLGVSSDVRVGLIARVHRPSALDVESDAALPSYPGRDQRCSGAGLLLALADSIGGPYEKERHPRGSNELKYPLSGAFELVQEHLRAKLEPFFPEGPVEIQTEELENQLLDDRLFLLFPDGTRDAPRWQAWPVADRRHPAVRNWEKRWANVLELDWDEDEEGSQELVDRLSNVGLSERGAVGNDVDSPEEFEGYGMSTREGGEIRSNSFVFFSNDVSAGEVPSINLQGSIDFGIDVVATDLDPNITTLALLDKAMVYSTGKALGRFPELIDLETVDQNTKEILFGSGSSAHLEADQVAAALLAGSNSAEKLAVQLAEQVNDLMMSVLLDPPSAAIQFQPPMLRFSSPAARWTFHVSERWGVSLSQLSSAEQRWATLAISIATAESQRAGRFQGGSPFRPILLVIDEPEAALHRAAEARVADFLVSWTRDPRHVAFVATHSPELLDVPEASLTEVSRQINGISKSNVRRLDLADRDALERLGLRPSDLLRWPRVFLLVEGEHDKQMIESYFGSRLRKARVELLPMRGAKQLASTIDSRVLFEYTNATVVALLDNMVAESVRDSWQQAQLARMTDGVTAAKQIVVDWFAGDKSEESRYMSGWLTSALDAGLESRLLPYGLSARDVIEYLPVSEIVPGAVTWEALHHEHQTDRALKKGHPNEFKPWLKTRKGVAVTEKLIQSALDAAPEPPADLEQMMKTLESVSAEPRAAGAAAPPR